MFKKLTLTQKILMANGVFGVVLCGLLYLLVNAKNEPIDFAKQELKGNTYQKSLEHVFWGLAKHHIQALRTKRNQKDLKSELSSTQSYVDQSIQKLEEVNQSIGSDLQFTEEGLKQRKREHSQFSTFKQEWTQFKQNLNQFSFDELNEKHSHLISDIRTMIVHAGDTSNLILDPDLDSYYLMDITLLALPQSQDRIRGVITELESRGMNVGKMEDKIKSNVYISMMKEADLERIKADFQTVLNEDSNFNGKLDSLEKKLTPMHNKFVEDYSNFIAKVEKYSSSAKPEDFSKAEYLEASEKALESSFQYWFAAVDELDLLLEKRIGVYENSKTNALMMSLLALGALAIFAWFFSKRLEIQLNTILSVLSTESKNLYVISKKVSTSSTSLADATTQQASALQETASSMEELSSMVKKNAENAANSLSVSQKSEVIANQGKEIVLSMNGAIGEISESNTDIMKHVEMSNQQISDIVSVIHEIGNKTKVIHDIVFQTKLLSFNASVEAARAGEHGKGFAVVAEEIGNLAQMSGNAAKEIGDLLSASTGKAEKIVQDTREKVKSLISQNQSKIKLGTKVAHECGDALEKIVQNVIHVTEMMNEISTATGEQNVGIVEINKAMNQLEEVTQENSSTSTQVADYSQNISTQAQALQEVVSKMETLIRGHMRLYADDVSDSSDDIEEESSNDKHQPHLRAA